MTGPNRGMMQAMEVKEGRRRLVIEGVQPEVDAGRFPIKRTVGEQVVVEADVFADGHDLVAASVLHRREQDRVWSEVPMAPLVNDRWRAAFPVTELGRYRYTLRAWIDRFGTWRRDFARKLEAGQNVSVELLSGVDMVERAAKRATGAAASALRDWARRLPLDREAALLPDLAALMASLPDRRFGTAYGRDLSVVVDRERARFSAWYELFPRSAAAERGRHGTFADVEERLPYIQDLGFDVVYLPPIHPIGRSFRKGRDNTVTAEPGDPGSPWAIGAKEGGHTSINPELGTMTDFERLVEAARARGMEIALDLAYQCSADHPYLKEHSEWFRRRPDGTIQYAENPPKRYQDIYPLDFETEAWRELWNELASIPRFWIAHGVRIFRVDNPHTKPFPFWEWMLGCLKAEHPDLIFLSEAFTRPKVMHRLAKLGFTQSYTYFAWRNAKWELLEYFGRDLPAVAEFFRPNLWPNTPDILTEFLQTGGRAAFLSRFILAATLGASYGIYGPAFELMEHEPLRPGSEEYLHSEKYEIRHWNLSARNSLRRQIALVNRIRRDNPALHGDRSLRFHGIDNDRLVAYSKRSPDGSNIILVVVNLDPRYTQSGWLDLDLEPLGLDADRPFEVHDLLTGSRYGWGGRWNFVSLDPMSVPAHVFRIRPHLPLQPGDGLGA
jgi:starch synthase (maltosyl-transferring)